MQFTESFADVRDLFLGCGNFIGKPNRKEGLKRAHQFSDEHEAKWLINVTRECVEYDFIDPKGNYRPFLRV